MKITDNKVEVVSNMKFDESVEMGIGHDAVPMVIERLISTYNQPARAVLREYTSNAYDIHVQGGVSVPVEVSLPDALSPSLRVRDYGVGLSRDELKGFGQFGVSTKRDSNDYTGGFGLGSKSGLAVASQFTVMSIKDGRRNTVIVARDEENRPHMNFLPETDTDEPSGTLITVPISNRSSLGDVGDFFLGWKPGSILVDDEAPKRSVHNKDQFRAIKDIAWYDLSGTTSPRDGIRVLINQVYYILDYRNMGLSFTEWGNLKNYIIKLDNGSVKIAPSREDLIYNTPTKAIIRERVDAILAVAGEAAAQAVSNAPTVKEALIAFSRLKSMGFPTDIAKWNGARILLPGSKFQGNTIPHQMGTWVNPIPSPKTKTGFVVEKNSGSISTYDITRDSPRNKFVIVHSAGPTERHRSSSSSRPRDLHREAFGAGDWVSTVDQAGPTGNIYYHIFITSEPLNRVNRWYREVADIIVSADDFNATAKAARDTRLAQERSDSKARKATSLLKVVVGSYYGEASIKEMSLLDISEKFDHVIFLRNQSPGMVGFIRDSLVTKKNYYSAYSNTALTLARESKSALILLNKTEKIDDAIPLLPPETTFGILAAEKVLSSLKSATVYERMAVRDRQDYDLGVLRILEEKHIMKIVNKETRSWVDALVNFRDSGEAVRGELWWMKDYDEDVAFAFDSAVDASMGGTSALPKSPAIRYPLLGHIHAYNTNGKDIVHYINLCDSEASAKKSSAVV